MWFRILVSFFPFFIRVLDKGRIVTYNSYFQCVDSPIVRCFQGIKAFLFDFSLFGLPLSSFFTRILSVVDQERSLILRVFVNVFLFITCGEDNTNEPLKSQNPELMTHGRIGCLLICNLRSCTETVRVQKTKEELFVFHVPNFRDLSRHKVSEKFPVLVLSTSFRPVCVHQSIDSLSNLQNSFVVRGS